VATALGEKAVAARAAADAQEAEAAASGAAATATVSSAGILAIALGEIIAVYGSYYTRLNMLSNRLANLTPPATGLLTPIPKQEQSINSAAEGQKEIDKA